MDRKSGNVNSDEAHLLISPPHNSTLNLFLNWPYLSPSCLCIVFKSRNMKLFFAIFMKRRE